MTNDTPDNPYQTYRVEFPYTCSFTIPEDDHNTRVTIESRSEVVRYGRDEVDIKHQLELDQNQGKPTYANHLLKWVNDQIWTVDPREVTVTYGDQLVMEPMSKDQIEVWTESCLNDD